MAQRWADNCQSERDTIRSIPGRFSVGQNVASGMPDWDAAIQSWYDGVNQFTYGQRNQSSDALSYIEVYRM